MTENIVFEDERTSNRFDVACCSGIGKRESQQDYAYCYVDDETLYAVVCDGMGGMGGGEIASRTGIRYVSNYYKEKILSIETNSRKIKDGDWMTQAALEADRTVYLLRGEDGERLGGGSTLVSAWIHGNRLYWSSVGDSRLYIFRGQESVQLTQDLNYRYFLQQRLEKGEISKKEYEQENQSGEALVSFLGHGEVEFIDHNMEALSVQAGDMLLLCSDGLYRTIDQEWMNDLLVASETMEEVVTLIHTIIKEQNKRNQDNYTGILIRIGEQGNE